MSLRVHYDMKSPRRQMRQEVSQSSVMDIETEQVEAEVLGLDREDPTEGIQSQRVESSPLDFGDTPQRDGGQRETSPKGHVEARPEHTQDAPRTHEEESLPESRGLIDHESVRRDAWLAEEMGQMPSLHFSGWFAFERLGQGARPHLPKGQTTGGLRVLYDDLTMQRTYIGNDLTAAREATEQLESQVSTLVRLRRETEDQTQRLFYEDAATAGWQEEVRMRRQTGEELMPEGERTQAEEGLQARSLLSEASVRELASVMEHVKRGTQTEVAREKELHDAVQRIDVLEQENRGLRDMVRDLVTSAQQAR
ncbi:hypothetical protein CBR_g55291 [Chara braunii]|uniref:Uncharacterized protein n=1 Tax=Chara braunii TaxID=69332 RepID=A0A388MCU1_CHABU|nr:hypothetical protein CBR_g55291 [Chara braunii]|eukprot:GBG92384.1 hypothetical protein CBR_g55291 [Chara braunii]